MNNLFNYKISHPAIAIFVLAGLSFSTVNSLRAESQWYKIDMIVFEQQSASHEHFRRKGNSVDWPRDTINLSGGGNRAYSTLSTTDSPLDSLYKRLQRSGAYTPLLHVAWIQPVSTNKSGKAVRISRNGINGYVRLQRGDYLHVVVDLNYRGDGYGEAGFNSDTEFGDSSNMLYRLKERRRILLKETHYFDHPKFGSVIRVSRLATN